MLLLPPKASQHRYHLSLALLYCEMIQHCIFKYMYPIHPSYFSTRLSRSCTISLKSIWEQLFSPLVLRSSVLQLMITSAPTCFADSSLPSTMSAARLGTQKYHLCNWNINVQGKDPLHCSDRHTL